MPLTGLAEVDAARSRILRDRHLVPGFYEVFYRGRYVLLDGEDRPIVALQQKFGIDTLIKNEDAGWVGIDEKLIPWKGRTYAHLFLETMSCTVEGREKTGWMDDSHADMLLYCFETEDGELDVWQFDLPALKRWFWPREDDYHLHRLTDPRYLNHPEGRLVPIDDIIAAVRHWPRMQPWRCKRRTP